MSKISAAPKLEAKVEILETISPLEIIHLSQVYFFFLFALSLYLSLTMPNPHTRMISSLSFTAFGLGSSAWACVCVFVLLYFGKKERKKPLKTGGGVFRRGATVQLPPPPPPALSKGPPLQQRSYRWKPGRPCWHGCAIAWEDWPWALGWPMFNSDRFSLFGKVWTRLMPLIWQDHQIVELGHPSGH